MKKHESKELFEFLRRDTECWHEQKIKRGKPYYCSCSHQEDLMGRRHRNPDFSKWSGFGWAIERCPEKGILFTIAIEDDVDMTIFDGSDNILHVEPFKINELPARFAAALNQFRKERSDGN